jgi:hypothetical protein
VSRDHTSTHKLDCVRPTKEEIALANEQLRMDSRLVGTRLGFILVIFTPCDSTHLDDTDLALLRTPLITLEAFARLDVCDH